MPPVAVVLVLLLSGTLLQSEFPDSLIDSVESGTGADDADSVVAGYTADYIPDCIAGDVVDIPEGLFVRRNFAAEESVFGFVVEFEGFDFGNLVRLGNLV